MAKQNGTPLNGTPQLSEVAQLFPQERLAPICEHVAKELGRALLVDMRHVADDVRQQFKDHNHLLARQEFIVQQLSAHVQRAAPSATLPPAPMPIHSKVKHAGYTSPGLSSCAACQDKADGDDIMLDLVREADRPTSANAEVSRNELSAQVEEPVAVRHAFENLQWVQPEMSDVENQDIFRMDPRASSAPSKPDSHHNFAPEIFSNDVGGEEGIIEVRASLAGEKAGAELAEVYADNHKSAPAVLTVEEGFLSGDCDKYKVLDMHVSRFTVGAAEAGVPNGSQDTVVAKICADGSGDDDDLKQKPDNGVAGARGSLIQHSSGGKGGGRTLFGDIRADKSSLDEAEYNVADFYHETGWAQAIAKSDSFANITLAVIGSNAMYIGVDADNNHEDNLVDADLGFQICEHAFCVFFTFEWLVRFFAFKHKRDGLKDRWFKFDTCLVFMMVIETWIVPVAFAGAGSTGIPTGLVKMLRLLRLFRMARLMRVFPELIAMIKGVKVASRAVGSALLMLVILVYVFAIVMFTLLKDEQETLVYDRFHTLPLTMWTLLIDGTFMDGIGLVSRSLIAIHAWPALCVLMVFVLGSAMTVMNMLIGVLCEVVSAVAAAEKEETAIRMVKDKLLFMLKEMDEDGSGMISRSEIQGVLENPDALSTLESLNVSVKYLMEQLDMFFEDGDDLAIHEIMDLILMLRGDRPPMMKDMLHSQTYNRWKLRKALIAQSEELSQSLQALTSTVQRNTTIGEMSMHMGKPVGNSQFVRMTQML